MYIPVEVVHRAAVAISDQGDISQTEFEDAYHCRFGLSGEPTTYWIHFDTQEYASIFLLRWM